MDTSRKIRAIDAAAFQQFAASIPTIITQLNLDPNSGWLYIHLKFLAGEKINCEVSLIELCGRCQLTPSQLNTAKKRLVDAGLISTGRAKSGNDIYTLVDIQALNFFFVLKRESLLDAGTQITVEESGPLFQAMRQQIDTESNAALSVAQVLPNNILSSNHDSNSNHVIHDNSDLLVNKSSCQNGSTKTQPQEKLQTDRDLKGDSSWQMLWAAVMDACGMSSHRMQDKDKGEIANCIRALQKDHSTWTGERLASWIRAFGIWWIHREIDGRKFGYPRPHNIQRDWGNFLKWCKDHTDGYQPTEETFKSGLVKA